MNNNKPSTKLINLPSIGFNIQIYFWYWLSIALAILLGLILRIIYIPNYNSLNLSFISGISFLKRRSFLIAITLNILFILWILYIFATTGRLRNHLNKSLIQYLKKLRCGFLFSNMMLLICYQMLKYQFFIPLHQSYDISLNLETLELIISGAMLNHLYHLCETFLSNKINIQLMTYFCLIAKSLLAHNVYCLLWISWIESPFKGLTFAFIITCVYVALIQMFSIDYIVLMIFETHKMHKKNKNLIYWVKE